MARSSFLFVAFAFCRTLSQPVAARLPVIMLRTLARGASMLSPSPFSPTAHPAKGSKVQAFDSGDVDAGVGQLFVVDLSALRMAAVNKLWKDARLRVCLDAKWSVNLFPLCYAVWAPGAHDSGLGGATAQYACCVKT